MPIEIKELILRTTVATAGERPTGQSKPQPQSDAVLEGIKELTRLIKEKNER